MKVNKVQLAKTVASVVEGTKVLDVHTHLYSPQFGKMLLWGIDELLTYHYLVAETFLHADLAYDRFWAMPKTKQADLIWETLFVRNTPVSEATRGVVTTLTALGFDPRKTPLKEVREYFASTTAERYVDLVLKTAKLEAVVMTNDVLDAEEQAVWARLTECDGRFLAAMRIDGLLNNWDAARPQLVRQGYKVGAELDATTCREVRRFLAGHAARMAPVYMAASRPPTFAYPEDSARGTLMENCILPFSREHGIPFAMMIGVKKLINPALQLAGDGLGKSDITALERLCERHPGNKFLVTMLSRENQHELAVTARKFNNLMVFGCWWFLNIPSVIEEMTAERIELLGPRFIPQHSDARVLDQLIYKWSHSRKIIAEVLTRKYADLMGAGWTLQKPEIERDVRAMFAGNFRGFVGKGV